MIQHFFADIQFLTNTFISFKYLNRIPALLFCRKFMNYRFFNMCQCMFHRTGEDVFRYHACLCFQKFELFLGEYFFFFIRNFIICHAYFCRSAMAVCQHLSSAFCCTDCKLCRLEQSVILQRRDFNHLTTDSLRQPGNVNIISVFPYHIHHVDGNHNRNTDFLQLGRQVQVTLQVRTIHDIQDSIRTLRHQKLTRYNFL